MKLTPILQSLMKSNIDKYRLSNYLLDEEYIDDNRNPLKCLHCDSEKIKKIHKIEFNSIEEKYKDQLMSLYPELENNIITFWICEDCDEVIAIKLYSHKNHQEKKIYYTKFDSFNEIKKDLKENGYLESNNEPCQCWYCKSDNINIKNREDRNVAICLDCNKVLGYEMNDLWMLDVNNI